MAGKFVVRKSSNGKFYFRLQAGNGESVLASEMYEQRASALNGIESVKKNASDEKRYERKQASKGPMFNLKAANGEIIGTSETYSSERARDEGLKWVMANAAGATTDDQSA